MMEVIMKKFLGRFSLVLFVLQACIVVDAFSVSWLDTVGGYSSRYASDIAQLGRTNAQLIEGLARNISAANITATTARLQVNPTADRYYFLPKAGTPENTTAAAPGLQAVAQRTEELANAVKAQVDAAAGTVVALELRNTGFHTALKELVRVLTTDYLKVYNQDLTALNSIPWVPALHTHTERLTAQANRIEKLATFAERAQTIRTNAQEIATRLAHAKTTDAIAAVRADLTAAEVALANATRAQVEAVTLATELHLAGTALQTQIDADMAQATAQKRELVERLASVDNLHKAVEMPNNNIAGAAEVDGDAPKYITLITKNLDELAKKEAAEITEETLVATLKTVTDKLVDAIKVDALGERVLDTTKADKEDQRDTFFEAWARQIKRDRTKLSQKLIAQKTLKARVDLLLNIYAGQHMRQAIESIAREAVAVITPKTTTQLHDQLLGSVTANAVAETKEQLKGKMARLKQWWSGRSFVDSASHMLDALMNTVVAPVVAPAAPVAEVRAPVADPVVAAPNIPAAKPAEVKAPAVVVPVAKKAVPTTNDNISKDIFGYDLGF